MRRPGRPATPPLRLHQERVFHRGPQAVRVEPGDVGLALLAGAVGHDRLALVVHLEHQLASPSSREYPNSFWNTYMT